jgi:undecaprenyl-diphosphatase
MALSSPTLQALLLGILQGLTEFLPISSSAHLILAPWFFGWQNSLVDSLTFDVALHAGTLVAILWYFWRDWMDLAAGSFRILGRGRRSDFSERLIVYLILATIPAAVAGFFLEKAVESTFRNPGLIVFPLVAVSFLMIFAESRNRPSQPLEKLHLRDAITIGIAQAIALLPGVSRSGITITTGLLLGYRRDSATRFSFLLSTPALAGAVILQSKNIFSLERADWLLFIIGFLSSAGIGYLAIAFLMRYLRFNTLNVFAGYRLVLAGGIIFAMLWRG